MIAEPNTDCDNRKKVKVIFSNLETYTDSTFLRVICGNCEAANRCYQ